MTKAIAATDFPAFVAERFSGKLTDGAHSPDGAACLHEAINVARGRKWSDDPSGMPDLRGLNDAPWSSDDARTTALLPVAVALWDFDKWPVDRKRAWAQRVASETIRRVLPIALRAAASVHPDKTHQDALTAAAETCIKEGSESAAAAAESAAESAADEPLILIAAILTEAAEEAADALVAVRGALWAEPEHQ